MALHDDIYLKRKTSRCMATQDNANPVEGSEITAEMVRRKVGEGNGVSVAQLDEDGDLRKAREALDGLSRRKPRMGRELEPWRHGKQRKPW